MIGTSRRLELGAKRSISPGHENGWILEDSHICLPAVGGSSPGNGPSGPAVAATAVDRDMRDDKEAVQVESVTLWTGLNAS